LVGINAILDRRIKIRSEALSAERRMPQSLMQMDRLPQIAIPAIVLTPPWPDRRNKRRHFPNLYGSRQILQRLGK
jgi:hypothetical protein